MQADLTSSVTGVDAAAIGVYLALVAGVTVFVNRSVGSSDTEHYFLGGRELPFWAIGFSLFASNQGTDHLVGLAGSGATQGLAVGLYEWNACLMLLVLGWVFVPHYLSCEIFTVPEYLEKRFDPSMRTFFSGLTILAAILTKISVTMFAGAVVIREVLGWSLWASSLSLLALTGIYTAIGGLAVVVYTEVLQSVILLVGCSALLVYALSTVGGLPGLWEHLPASHFALLRPASDTEFPWPGVLIGMPINSIWYWCTDQVLVQRVLAAKSVSVGQSACTMAGWLKLLPMALMVLPGLVAAALYPEEMKQDSNRAFALLVKRLLPPGWQGAMIAVMLSSFMAALSSCFNSCSTLFTMDLYARWYPDVSDEQHLVKVGRLFTLVLAAASVAWVPIVELSGKELFIYIQDMQGILCAPITVVFVASIVSKRVSAATAWTTLLSGLLVNSAFWIYRSGLVPERFRHSTLMTFSALYFTILSCAFCSLLLLLLHLREYSRGDFGELQVLVPKEVPNQQKAGRLTHGFAAALVVLVTGLTAVGSLGYHVLVGF